MKSAYVKTAFTIAVPAAKLATCKPRLEARAPVGNHHQRHDPWCRVLPVILVAMFDC
jgi:hypothetical protein